MRDHQPVKGGLGALLRSPGSRRRNFIIFMSVGLLVVIPLLVMVSVGVFHKDPGSNVGGGTDGDVSVRPRVFVLQVLQVTHSYPPTDSLISSLFCDRMEPLSVLLQVPLQVQPIPPRRQAQLIRSRLPIGLVS